MPTNTRTQLKVITKRLQSYRPEKIILFGSYAWGRPTKSSDVDLLVVKDSKKLKHHRITDVERILYPSPLPVDVLVYTPSELKRRLALGDFFLIRIVRDGKVLYERK